MKRTKSTFLLFFALLLGFLAFLPSDGFAKRPQILALADLKPGANAIGFSVFKENKIEPFNVLLGNTFNNVGMTYIYARISGGPMETQLEQMGAIAGMSGSPVFIDCTTYEECVDHGVLVGAISLGISKIPLGGMNSGITPAEKMLGSSSGGFDAVNSLFASTNLPQGMSYPILTTAPPGLSENLQTKGITAASPSSEKTSEFETDAQAKLKPGSMISVYLASGDIPIAVSGTVTWVDENRIYAFGHHLFGKGIARYPFAQISVSATIQNPLEPYKSPGRILGNRGVITLDGATEISGIIGENMQGIPFRATLQINAKNFALDENVTPNTPYTDTFLTQLPAFWISRIAGDAKNLSLKYQVRLVLQGQPEILIRNTVGAAFKQNPVEKLTAALAGVIGQLTASGFPFALESLKLDTELLTDSTLWQKERVFLSKAEALPGETVILSIVLRKFQDDGVFRKIDVPIAIPADILSRKLLTPFASIGILVQSKSQFTKKIPNYRPPRELTEVIAQINENGLYRPDAAYVQIILPPRIEGVPVPQNYEALEKRGTRASDGQKEKRKKASQAQKKEQPPPQSSEPQKTVQGWQVIDSSVIPQEAGLNGKPEVILYILPPLYGVLDLSEELELVVKTPPPPVTEQEPPKKKKRFWLF
ncbi:MAG: hypothetical protein Q7S09_03990 [bacterium]|nr:hypothetical protein [bacterium]